MQSEAELRKRMTAFELNVLLLMLQAVTFPATDSASSGSFLTRHSRNNEDGGVAFKQDRPSTSSLVMLQMLFRHGDRSPIHFFPWDKHNSFWPQGSGQLTQVGMQQAYDYGQELRLRYSRFLPKNYNRSQVEVKSTDVDRTLMTAQCLLTGLFPANFSNWPLSPWQPIPIHTQPDAQNNLLSHSPCPMLDKLNKEFKDPEPRINFNSKHKALIDQISSLTNATVENPHGLADTIFCEAQHNLSRPEWMSDKMFQELMDLRNESNALAFIAPGTARLGGGPLLFEMMKNMEDRSKDPTLTKKLFLFSAHDTNIANFGRALGIFNNLQPPYVTSIIVELHEQDGDFFVMTFFDNHTAEAPYLKNISGCASKCPLSQFHNLLKDNMLPPDERPAACAVSESVQGISKTVTVLVVVSVVLVVAGVLYLLYRLKKARQKRNGRENNIQYHQLLQPPSDTEDDDEVMAEL